MYALLLILVFYVVLICTTTYNMIKKRIKKVPFLSLSFEESIPLQTTDHLIGLLAMANPFSHATEEHREQSMFVESELMQRYISDTCGYAEDRLIRLYFENPETILDHVKLDIIEVPN